VNSGAERIWRLRKSHASIDARLCPLAEQTAFEVRFFYDGSMVFLRRFQTRDEAVAFASRLLPQFQRAGWNTHW